MPEGRGKADFVGKRSLARPDMVAADRRQLVGLLTEDLAVVLEDVTDADLERLDFYEAVFGYGRREALVEVMAMRQWDRREFDSRAAVT